MRPPVAVGRSFAARAPEREIAGSEEEDEWTDWLAAAGEESDGSESQDEDKSIDEEDEDGEDPPDVLALQEVAVGEEEMKALARLSAQRGYKMYHTKAYQFTSNGEGTQL